MDLISGLIGILVKFVFKLILKLFDIIFAPIVAIFMGLFPDLGNLGVQVLSFVTTYIVPGIKFMLSVAYNLLGIPPIIIGTLVTYFLFLVSGRAVSIGVTCAMNIYQKLKP